MPISLPQDGLDDLRAAADLARTAYSAWNGDRDVVPDPDAIDFEWRDESGARVGAAGQARLADVRVEMFDPDGVIESDAITHIEGLVDPPEASHALLLASRSGWSIEYQRESIEVRALPPIAPRIFSAGSNPSFRFPVFAERFADETRFHDFVEALLTYIVGIPPFDKPEIKGKFGLAAHFWPDAPEGGWFDTPRGNYVCGDVNNRLLYGNQQKAVARIGPYMHVDAKGRRYGLVLIDTDRRGGAGGMPDHGYPSWASVTGCFEKDWEAVALHEIAHSFGLADEYLDPAREGEVSNGEPNVSDIADTSGTLSWGSGVTVSGNPTATLAQQAAGAAGHPDDRDVGTFQGARYRKDFYRPSLTCLMRTTATRRFCPVCEHVIETFLQTA